MPCQCACPMFASPEPCSISSRTVARGWSDHRAPVHPLRLLRHRLLFPGGGGGDQVASVAGTRISGREYTRRAAPAPGAAAPADAGTGRSGPAGQPGSAPGRARPAGRRARDVRRRAEGGAHGDRCRAARDHRRDPRVSRGRGQRQVLAGAVPVRAARSRDVRAHVRSDAAQGPDPEPGASERGHDRVRSRRGDGAGVPAACPGARGEPAGAVAGAVRRARSRSRPTR